MERHTLEINQYTKGGFMGEMADWLYDLDCRKDQEFEYQVESYYDMEATELIECLESCMSDSNYDYNDFSEMMCSIYITYQCGYKLTDRQKRSVSVHMASQCMDNWY